MKRDGTRSLCEGKKYVGCYHCYVHNLKKFKLVLHYERTEFRYTNLIYSEKM